MLIKIKVINNPIFTIEINENNKIIDLEEKIKEKIKLSNGEIKLVYHGRILKENDILKDLNIIDNVNVIIRHVYNYLFNRIMNQKMNFQILQHIIQK